RVIPADTSSDNPAQAASVTRRMISEDHVSVLVGAHTSTMTLSAQIEAERSRIPLLTTSYADQIVERGLKYTFKIPPQASAISAAGMDDILALYEELKATKIQRVAIFYGADAASQAIGAAYIKDAKAKGLDIVAQGSFPGNLADPTPILGPVRAHKPQVLFMNAFVDDMILVTRALRSLGIMIPVVGSGSGISVKSIGQSLGKDANNLMGTLVWNWDLPIPGVPQFRDAYKAAYPKQPFAPQEAGEGYAIGQIIAAALEAAKSRDPRTIRDALTHTNLQTILPGGPVQFAANGQNKNAVAILVSWINGELRTLWPKPYAAVTPVLP
ncbi:MAG: ABC transporter substrate-binding protein, partial [Rhodospirillales bacterium]|nr:ABC transporter substrate-binding protein [Rhodospirillales bacterium]